MSDLLALMRPTQWVKNGFVLAALLFSQRFLEPETVVRALVAVAAFCLASSAAYVFNDLLDRRRDRLHPLKNQRPLACGRVSVRTGVALGTALAASALALGAALGMPFLAFVAGFLALQAAYSLKLKHLALVDAVVLASGFVLRTAAGVVAIDARMSGWLLACTFFLALFLALGKRRHELILLGAGAGAHRSSLATYEVGALDASIMVSAGCALVLYTLYSLTPQTAERLGTQWFPATVPFVVWGVFRYLFVVYRRERGGNPTDVLLRDTHLQAAVVLWVAAVLLLLYR